MRLLNLCLMLVLFVCLLSDAYGSPEEVENVVASDVVVQPLSLLDVAEQGHENEGDRLTREHRGGYRGGSRHYDGRYGGHYDGHYPQHYEKHRDGYRGGHH
ncbi:uncharacterized protein LOC118743717 [Rhagoletis pomonella]|uniref:uncharacterized protein LOC118743717 n=1 Tax=Rhagoletis pomonella TaxID=28610 RepID=UPI001782E834|nr:uncharacterized protein LOC118743717 [Rhagoletis pomonella]